jgi:prolyl oligopeptidase
MTHVVNGPPLAVVEPVRERLHGVEIADPYRWLEDQESPKTRRWLEEQAAYSAAYFATVPMRERVRSRVCELLSIPMPPQPWKVGNKYFFLKRIRQRENPVIVMRSGLEGDEIVLIDPASHGKNVAVSIFAISEDGRYLAYWVRNSGADHAAIEIFDVQQNAVLPDRLPAGLCTGFAFAPDGSGFYYAQHDLLSPRERKVALWHRIGTAMANDVEVFSAGDGNDTYLGITVSSQLNILMFSVYVASKHPSTSIYIQPIKPTAETRLLIGDVGGSFLPFFTASHLLALTDLEAPNSRIVSIDLDNPSPAQWKDVVTESGCRIQAFAVASDELFVTRSDGFSVRLETYSLKDGERREIRTPSYASIDLLENANSTDTLFCSITSITQPATTYRYSRATNELAAWHESDAYLDPATIAVEETSYPSVDGTSIPVILIVHKDFLHAGPLPTFLTGYGGFGRCVTPRFSAFATFLIEQGFLYAVPALRGGSELGEQWHRAGQGKLRQNAFDDFIAAAEWLLLRRRSAEGRVAIGGGSNAGLLVGAAITQRPDLFRATICLGPLLDMTRYHLFDRASAWAEEYGSPQDEQDFHHLLKYSPYHSVKDGAQYPAVLLISGDADTRCNPMHARKMTARLQAANRSEHPILLDYKPAWGHTPVQPLPVKIESLTDRLAFICHELGVSVESRRLA